MNEDDRSVANDISKASAERTTMRKYSLFGIGITQIRTSSRNDATAETGTNEAQGSSA